MHTQFLSISLLQLIFTVILVTLPVSYTSNSSDQFIACSNLYNCGENIAGVGYPFWGDNRPQSCGLEGFELKCQNNDYPTISMGNQLFSVLGIQESSLQMTMAHLDVDRKICKQGSLYNTDLNEALFAYSPGVEFVNVYYNCPDINTTTSSASQKKICKDNGLETNSILTLDPVPGLEECTFNISVPVLDSAIQEFKNNISMELGNEFAIKRQPHLMRLEDIFKQGFNVDYKIDETYCSACKRSGGFCWSGTTDTPQKTCLCKDEAKASVCSSQQKEESDPQISPSPQGSPSSIHGGTVDGGGRSNSGMKIGIGICAAIIGILSVCAIIFITKAFKNRITKEDQSFENCIKEFGSSIPQRYRYSDIKKMTKSFKDELGVGGFGTVYKGCLSDGRLVAVKRLNSLKGTGQDFINEVASIGRTSHVNVVALLGFCYERKKRALIYEFMPNGSLDKFIYRENQETTEQGLGWDKLYKITLGIARGLEYLHRGCSTRILHLDIKPHNILLDEEFQPKISDFGLAKVYSGKESIVSMKGGRGTLGYSAPEVGNKNFGGVSHKSDVYSYGKMVLEMVGGRKNLDVNMFQDKPSKIYFPDWIYNRVEHNEDLSLYGEMTKEENHIARKMIIVALWCIQNNPSERPSMNKVIEMLEGSTEALQLPPKP